MRLKASNAVLALLLATGAGAQVIDSGSTTDQYYSPDPTASYSYSKGLSAQQGVYKTLRAAYPGKTIHYDIPQSNGTCNVTLDLLEPRAAGTVPSTTVAVGLRVFTAQVSGVISPPIDIFLAAGSQV